MNEEQMSVQELAFWDRENELMRLYGHTVRVAE